MSAAHPSAWQRATFGRWALALACAVAVVAPGRAATVVVMAPHPDDAEASCGGLIANAVAAGDRVLVLTMTGGERGAGPLAPDAARRLRQAEARRAAEALGAQVHFFDGEDGALEASAAALARLSAWLDEHPADTVLAPWPLDIHPDHQATGQLAWQAFQNPRWRFALYFYETTNAPHAKSFQFVPTDYVDITAVMARKREATRQHRSQNPDEWFGLYETLARLRGMEADVGLAEGYVRARNASGLGGRAAQPLRTLPRAP